MNIKVFSVIVRTNEKRYIKWHQTSKCQCRLDASVYNIKKYGMKINGDVNTKKLLTKEHVIKDLIRILAIVNVNVINNV